MVQHFAWDLHDCKLWLPVPQIQIPGSHPGSQSADYPTGDNTSLLPLLAPACAGNQLSACDQIPVFPLLMQHRHQSASIAGHIQVEEQPSIEEAALETMDDIESPEW